MIAKTQAFKTSDDKTFENLALAQEHELELLLQPAITEGEAPALSNICKSIVAEAEKVQDILSTRPNSRAKARAINGATRKKRAPKGNGVIPTTAANLALK